MTYPLLRVELAFGADPTTDPVGWTWTDVSDHVADQDITITRGRRDETADPEPAQTTVTLFNLDGRFTPHKRDGAYWPEVTLGVPVRISARLEDDDPWNVRFVGQVSEWAPTWVTFDEAHCAITCNGVLRRLGQGQRPLESALARHLPVDGDVVAYWPLETGSLIEEPASPIDGVRPITRRRRVEWGADDTLPGSKPLPKIPSGGKTNWSGRPPAVDTTWTAHMLVRVPAVSSETTVMRLWTATGQLRVTITSTQLFLYTRLNDDPAAGWSGLYAAPLDADPTDDWFRVSVTCTTGGFQVRTTFAGDTTPFGHITATGDPQVRLTAAGLVVNSAPSDGIAFGHLAISDTPDDWTPDADLGHQGETAADRFERLGAEEGLTVEIIGDTDLSTPLGPQRPKTLLELLAEAAAAEAGMWGELVDEAGVFLRTRQDRYTQPTDWDLTVADIDEPFTPILDDQRTRNDITVTRDGGASARATDIDGDVYDETVTLSLHHDAQARFHAEWRLRAGTWDEMRYPQVTTDRLLALGDRVKVSDLPAQHPAAAADLVVEGLTETILGDDWTVTANCSPAGVWDVAILEDDTIVDARLDTSEATLDADATALASTITVTGGTWATGDVPFDIAVGVETMTVTNITGTGPYTFTVTRPEPLAHTAGAAVHVTPGLVAAL